MRTGEERYNPLPLKSNRLLGVLLSKGEDYKEGGGVSETNPGGPLCLKHYIEVFHPYFCLLVRASHISGVKVATKLRSVTHCPSM